MEPALFPFWTILTFPLQWWVILKSSLNRFTLQWSDFMLLPNMTFKNCVPRNASFFFASIHQCFQHHWFWMSSVKMCTWSGSHSDWCFRSHSAGWVTELPLWSLWHYRQELSFHTSEVTSLVLLSILQKWVGINKYTLAMLLDYVFSTFWNELVTVI